MLISKNSIKVAGKKLRDGIETNKDLDLILTFRTNHISIMATPNYFLDAQNFIKNIQVKLK